MLAIIQFELRQKFRSLSTYVYFLMFFSLAMLWMAAAGGVFSSATISFGGKTFINAPSSVSQTITFLGYLGTVIVAAMMGRAVQQDTEYNIWHFFFTSPISRMQYLGGRFIGAFLTLLAIFSSLGLGAWLGCYLPGIEPVRLGPVVPMAYVLPYLFSIIPNLLIFGAVFFTLGALVRRMLPVYVASVVLLIGYLIAGSLFRDMDNRSLAALIDPFGSRAISKLTEYWSVSDKNTRLVPLSGVYLTNRLIWSVVGIAVAALCYWRFRFNALNMGGKQKKESTANIAAPRAIPALHLDFGSGSLIRLFFSQTRLNLKETVKNIYFVAILLCGVLFMFASSSAITKMFGTPTYPVTYAVLEVLSGTFALFMLIITTFYAGEMVWRERDARISQMLDALPVPNALPFAAKLTALILLQGILLAILMICGLLIQTVKGYTHYEIGQYVYQLFLLQWPDYMLVAVLAMAVQVLVNHKYAGYFIMIAYYILSMAAASIGLEHPMLIYGNVPGVVYSDINGYGHFIPAIRWTQLYWGGAALVLVAASARLWVRGTSSSWKERLQALRGTPHSGSTALAATGLVLFAAGGGVLFYFYNIFNIYRSSYDAQELQAQYEKQYQALQNVPQPRITEVSVAVDIHPENRSAHIRGDYILENKTASAITDVYLNQDNDSDIIQMQLAGASACTLNDKTHGFYGYHLQQALQPGEKTTLHFELNYGSKTFLGMSRLDTVLENGTFFNSGLMPIIGYQPRQELSEDKERRKHGLKEKERMAPRDDVKALTNSYINNDADWIRFDATVSTSPDQIAIAPGKLDREWMENGRRYFHYRMDKPILNFYSFQSGRYAVKKAQWKDVAIEIDYQSGHEYNLDQMIKGVQKALDYYTTNFGPYQHSLVRIIEFPRYRNFAQAFPNTIPFSEAIGFIAHVDPKDPKDIDYPFYVTAHEVAHQWWAHQVVSGNTQGATTLVETLAQYSALMVMKHEFGPDKMRRFLSYELDRYLMGRGQERKKELPLALNENQQYIHYSKGSLAMYLTQDIIGEDKVNQALRKVLAEHSNKAAPYPTSRALVDALREVATPDQQALINDLFESIILFEDRAVSASARKIADNQYEITLKVSARKFKADELGAEKEIPVHEWMDIGADDADGKPLLRERKLISQKESSFTFRVTGLPAKAGIDPDNKYIDRNPDDNMIKVTLE